MRLKYRLYNSYTLVYEIDDLTSVRSSRRDQIHGSIVSTLLALMDGLDERGEVIIIGATNRLDSFDPALRRPDRFDRELKCSLSGQYFSSHNHFDCHRSFRSYGTTLNSIDTHEQLG